MKKGVVGVCSALIGAVIGAAGVERVSRTKVNRVKQLSDKHLKLFLMMNQWVKVKQEGKEIASFFQNNGYKKIAIYGMSYAGETLLEELKGTDIEVAYGIDSKADSIYANIDIVTIEDSMESVDVIVVTAITFFDEIEEKLNEKVDCPIVSLEDILFEM